MDYMNLRKKEEAEKHMLAAWELARPDDLIEGLGEHHGLLGGMLEAVIKPGWPEDFKRIIDITYRFSAGWRRVHNPDTGHDVADNLTTTEFTVAMLAARGMDESGDRATHEHIPAYGQEPHIDSYAEAGHKQQERSREAYAEMIVDIICVFSFFRRISCLSLQEQKGLRVLPRWRYCCHRL